MQFNMNYFIIIKCTIVLFIFNYVYQILLKNKIEYDIDLEKQTIAIIACVIYLIL